MVKCSNCGYESEESNFCPNCRSKLIKSDFSTQKSADNKNNMEPNKSYDIESQDINFNGNEDLVDEIMDADYEISGKITDALGKSKTVNKISDKFSSFNYNAKNDDNSTGVELNRKYFEKFEPEFLEVLDSIDDKLVKAVLLCERNSMGVSANLVLTAAAMIYTPTKEMSHDEAITFYQDMVNRIVAEIDEEKQKSNFDEEEFYKRKAKKIYSNNAAILIPRSLKKFKKNRDNRFY